MVSNEIFVIIVGYLALVAATWIKEGWQMSLLVAITFIPVTFFFGYYLVKFLALITRVELGKPDWSNYKKIPSPFLKILIFIFR